jgi:NAD-dependent deacetylase
MNTLSCHHCQQTFASQLFHQGYIDEGIIPHCPNCQSTLKPDIVLFEEMLPEDTWQSAAQHSQQADVFLVAGSSLEVMPAAGLPYSAVENNAALILINLTPTYLDDQAAVLLPMDVAVALPGIMRYLR